MQGGGESPGLSVSLLFSDWRLEQQNVRIHQDEGQSSTQACLRYTMKSP